MAIVDKGVEVVMGHDVGGQYGHGNAHVGIVGQLHGGPEVEIFEVTNHTTGTGCGDDTVEEQFGSDEVSSFGADIAGVFNLVTANGPSYTMWDSFFRPVCTNDAEVGGKSSFGNGRNQNEKDGVGSGGRGSTLCQAMNLRGIGMLPQEAIRAGAKLFVFS